MADLVIIKGEQQIMSNLAYAVTSKHDDTLFCGTEFGITMTVNFVVSLALGKWRLMIIIQNNTFYGVLEEQLARR